MESFANARFKARLTTPPKPRPVALSPEERAVLLMRAVTMDEIKDVARRLGVPFGVAYRDRKQLYARRPMSDWCDILGGRTLI